MYRFYTIVFIIVVLTVKVLVGKMNNDMQTMSNFNNIYLTLKTNYNCLGDK